MTTGGPTIGLVVAMAVESRWVGPSDGRHLLEVGGIGGRRAATAARRLVARGAGALVSWGVAGGLDPALTPGTVVLADVVIHPDGSSRRSDAGWRARLEERIRNDVPTVVAPLFHADEVVSSAAQKGAINARWGAAVVDMETDAIAGVAEELGVPWLAIRVVTDTASMTLPPAVSASCGADGRLRVGSVAKFALSPWLWPKLIRLAGTTAAGARSMRRVWSVAGPDLGLVEVPDP